MATNNNPPRKVITFAQLLKLAGPRLRGVTTEIVQLPDETNKRTAVFRATVIMLDSVGEMRFQGTGEATPSNVKPGMETCLPRIAETRAVVRALKLAVGSGDVAAEELADYDETEAVAAQPVPRRATVDMNGPIQPGQIDAIGKLCRARKLDPEREARSKASVSLENLSAAQAGELIADLNKRPVAA